MVLYFQASVDGGMSQAALFIRGKESENGRKKDTQNDEEKSE